MARTALEVAIANVHLTKAEMAGDMDAIARVKAEFAQIKTAAAIAATQRFLIDPFLGNRYRTLVYPHCVETSIDSCIDTGTKYLYAHTVSTRVLILVLTPHAATKDNTGFNTGFFLTLTCYTFYASLLSKSFILSTPHHLGPCQVLVLLWGNLHLSWSPQTRLHWLNICMELDFRSCLVARLSSVSVWTSLLCMR